ncbi:sulfotransferase 2B1-like [Pseudophryne corroboree]|uniref:sulfotransferase 2B1-like n=1 Tax=Pseudophryne corroboree TaxID=495146 RepID=UPI003081E5E4
MTFNYFTRKGIRFDTKTYSEESLSYAENGFDVWDDDIYNVTYPKSGTNWMIQILNLIKHKGDATLSNTVPIYSRSPWYETVMGQTQIKDLVPPRIMSSHLPINMFAKSFFKSKAKIIYTVRNPRDILVSLFHFTKIYKMYSEIEQFQDFLDDFLQGNAMYGSWFEHVKGWMQMKDDSRFFFIAYEELLQDLRGSVVRICKFLGQEELDDAQIDLVVEHSAFKAMKENKMSNWSLLTSELLDHAKGSFLRKGIAGDWKNLFTVAQSESFNKVYQEKMKYINTTFYWENDNH